MEGVAASARVATGVAEAMKNGGDSDGNDGDSGGGDGGDGGNDGGGGGGGGGEAAAEGWRRARRNAPVRIEGADVAGGVVNSMVVLTADGVAITVGISVCAEAATNGIIAMLLPVAYVL